MGSSSGWSRWQLLAARFLLLVAIAETAQTASASRALARANVDWRDPALNPLKRNVVTSVKSQGSCGESHAILPLPPCRPFYGYHKEQGLSYTLYHTDYTLLEYPFTATTCIFPCTSMTLDALYLSSAT